MSTMDGDFAAMMDCNSLVDGEEDQVLLESNVTSPSRGQIERAHGGPHAHCPRSTRAPRIHKIHCVFQISTNTLNTYLPSVGVAAWERRRRDRRGAY